MVYLHSFDELYLTSTFDTSVFDAVICELHDKVKHNVRKPDIQDRRSLHMVKFTASILLYLLIFTHITSLVFLLLLFTFLQTEKSWRNLMISIYCMLFNQTFLETTRRLHLNESWSINNPSLVMYCEWQRWPW